MDARETRELVEKFEKGVKLTDFELGILLGIFSTLVSTLTALPEAWHTAGLTEARVVLTRLERMRGRRKSNDGSLYTGA